MFAAPPVIQTKIFAQLPAKGGLLEGPSFDRAGNLYVVDIPSGRVFRIAPNGDVKTIAEYDGEPNGLKIHKDGRIFIADHKQGLLTLDPQTGKTTVVLDRPYGERFKGLNDLVFARNGDLYFSDQGETGLQDPTGRLYRLRVNGQLDLLLDNVPSANGIVLNLDDSILFLGATRGNNVWRVPLNPEKIPQIPPHLQQTLHASARVGRVGVWLQLSGGIGPDGMAMDVEGRISVTHPGLGTVWIFDRNGEPVYRVRSCAGGLPTNVAYGGPNNRTLYITEAEAGCVLTAELDVSGCLMYSHLS